MLLAPFWSASLTYLVDSNVVPKTKVSISRLRRTVTRATVLTTR